MSDFYKMADELHKLITDEMRDSVLMWRIEKVFARWSFPVFSKYKSDDSPGARIKDIFDKARVSYEDFAKAWERIKKQT